MARASGPATAGLLTGEFTHAASGVHYRLLLRDGKAYLAYSRDTTDIDRILHGEVQLRYFVGSGMRGRTYLFENDGFWFESPVNWYGKKRVWDMAPAYGNAKRMPFTLPVDADCLHCHASGVQTSLPGARNHFPAAPFLHAGITCEACHGDPAAHLAQGGKGPILNPAKLSPARRDSICLQCHLEGEVAVNRLGRSLSSFRPGDELYNDVTYYVHQGEIGAHGRASSQWEALLQSACKRKSGDRMTCTTCHDAHSTPAAAERVSFYRGKCLGCHTGAKFSRRHFPQQPDCASCHMPREPTEDIAHEQVTDHRIQIPTPGALRSEGAPALQPPSSKLVPIDGAPSTPRDLGLAYAQMAEHGNRRAGERAMQLLQQAEHEGGAAAHDPDLHTELGFLDQMSGDLNAAAEEYEIALRALPADGTAAGDLAVLDAHAGKVTTAVDLWRTAFQENPGVTAAGIDLAVGECALGNPQAAIAALHRVLSFSPDDGKARQLLNAIAGGIQYCAAPAPAQHR